MIFDRNNSLKEFFYNTTIHKGKNLYYMLKKLENN
jgi:hypothetical protein